MQESRTKEARRAKEQALKLSANGFKASFLSDEAKAALLAKLDAFAAA